MESSPKEEHTGRSARDEFLQFRRSSRNRESFDDLAAMEAELRRAYVAKELQVQILERDVERYIESVRNRGTAEETQHELQAAAECELKERSEAQERSTEYRRQLEEQMTRKREERRLSAERERLEREVLREVDRVREENERSRLLERKEELAESMRRQWHIQQEVREIERDRERDVEALEFLRDQRYVQSIEKRHSETRRVQLERAAKRERILQQVAEMIMRPELEKRERESILNELVAEDIERELIVKEHNDRVRKEKLRGELAAGLIEQILFTEECKARFLERDREFAEEVMRRIMKDERTERLTSEARRRMQAQYRQDLAMLIEERRECRKREIARMQEYAQEEKDREETRARSVREERKRLLQEHAANVADFVNPSTLSADERAIIERKGGVQ